jgi:tetratricopeptide (TPR) repeat protein
MRRTQLILVVLVLWALSAVLQTAIDPQRKQFEPKVEGLFGKMTGLPTEYIFGTMLGFREVVAGALWVRADSFFHEGNYDAILPIIRLVTWLDPHNLDVYSTGAWHIGYNFTDTEQRSDRRYLSAALKLLEEGVENNPDVYDLYFEMGWMWYDKIKQAHHAVRWFQKAYEFPNRPDEYSPGIPPSRRHMLAHAWENAGLIDQCLQTWADILKGHERYYETHKKEYMAKVQVDVAKHNYALTDLRQYNRYEKQPPDTQPPIDVKFDAKVRVVEPKIIEVSGTVDLGTYFDEQMQKQDFRPGRVDVTLRDEGYQSSILPTDEKAAGEVWRQQVFTFDVPDVTIMQEQIAILKGKFKRKIDMSKDPMMYSFKAPRYVITVRFNPLYAPPQTQDRIGWRGEGLTDKRYLRIDKVTTVDKDGKEYTVDVRRVRKHLLLTREQLLSGKGEAVEYPGLD